MKRSRLLATGVIGSIIAALCCFTPILLILLGVVGLASWTGYLDYVLMPALVFFVALTVYAYMKKDNGKCYKRDREADHE